MDEYVLDMDSVENQREIVEISPANHLELEIVKDQDVSDSEFSKGESDLLKNPLQVGVIILGHWGKTRKALQYLILHLNSQQDVFEFQLFNVDSLCDIELIEMIQRDPETANLMREFFSGPTISSSKIVIKETVNKISQKVYDYYYAKYSSFDDRQLPRKYIFLTPFAHIDQDLFQIDGSKNFEHPTTSIAGALLITGSHKDVWNPPSVIEFIYKFIIRISVNWLEPSFNLKSKRHFGQKGCLFDTPNSCNRSLIQNMVLQNFICQPCKRIIGETISEKMMTALDMKQLYSEEIDMHPAKVCHRLGYNLSMTSGIYQSRFERFRNIFSESLYSRLGAIFGMIILGVIVVPLGLREVYLGE